MAFQVQTALQSLQGALRKQKLEEVEKAIENAAAAGAEKGDLNKTIQSVMGKYFHFGPAQPTENPFVREDPLALRYPHLNSQRASFQQAQGANGGIELFPADRSTPKQDNGDGSIARGSPYYESAIAIAEELLQEQRQSLQRRNSGWEHMVQDMETAAKIPVLGAQAASDKFSNASSGSVRFAEPVHSELGPTHQAEVEEDSSSHISHGSNPTGGYIPVAMAAAKERSVHMGPGLTDDDQDEFLMDDGVTAEAGSGLPKASAAQKKPSQQKTVRGAKVSKAITTKSTTLKSRATRKPPTAKPSKAASDNKDTSHTHSGLPGPVRLRKLNSDNMHVATPAIDERPTPEKRRPGRPRKKSTTATDGASGGSGTASVLTTAKASAASDVTDTIHEGLSGTQAVDFQHPERLPTSQPQTHVAQSQDGQQLPTPVATPACHNGTLKRPYDPQENSETSSISPVKRQRIFKEQPIQPIANLGGDTMEEGVQAGDFQEDHDTTEIGE